MKRRKPSADPREILIFAVLTFKEFFILVYSVFCFEGSNTELLKPYEKHGDLQLSTSDILCRRFVPRSKMYIAKFYFDFPSRI